MTPVTASSRWAKLCTCHHWFGRPSKINCEPCHELTMSIGLWCSSKWGRVTRVNALPIEQGRFVRPSLPRHLCRGNLCSTQPICNELITSLTAPASMLSGLSSLTCFRVLRCLCICSCGTKIRRLSAIASSPSANSTDTNTDPSS